MFAIAYCASVNKDVYINAYTGQLTDKPNRGQPTRRWQGVRELTGNPINTVCTKECYLPLGFS